MENFEKIEADGFCPKTQISCGTSENRDIGAKLPVEAKGFHH
jgi:hypothetical protein